MSAPLLEVDKLVTSFRTETGWVRAVDGVGFTVDRGKTVGLVGESGCGKTVTAMSIINLLPQPAGNILDGRISWRGEDLRHARPRRLEEVRGGEIGVIFQEPMSALNPVHRIGKQLIEAVRLHRKMSKQAALAHAVELLDKVGIPAPERRIMDYPHQLSGGMRQRVMIAMAISCDPDLLIADEPTTALDVTVQAQILDLIAAMQKDLGMAVLLITHDLGVIAENSDEVVVMYAGRVVERAPVKELFANPLHAYTKGLLSSIPRLEYERKSLLRTIEGQVAAISDFVPGCRFCQRVGREGPTLEERPPFEEVKDGHWVEACPECYGK